MRKSYGLYSKKECFNEDEQNAYLLSSLQQITSFAYKNSMYYKQIINQSGFNKNTFTKLEDFEKIPVTRKRDLILAQKNMDRLLTKSPGLFSRIYLTPNAFFVFEDKKSSDAWGTEEALYAAGFTERDIVLNMLSYHLSPLGSIFDKALEALGSIPVPVGTFNIEHLDPETIKLFENVNVNGFIGTPSSFAKITENYNGNVPFEIAYLLGEHITPKMKEYFKTVVPNTRIVQGIVLSEFGILGYECHHGEFHIPTNLYAEICHEGTNIVSKDKGEIVITHLSRKGCPLIRYGTGILGRIVHKQCECGRTNAILTDISFSKSIWYNNIFVDESVINNLLFPFFSVKKWKLEEREGKYVLKMESDTQLPMESIKEHLAEHQIFWELEQVPVDTFLPLYKKI